MVKDYVEQLYEPTAVRTDALAASDLAGARALAAWKARVVSAWKAVHIDRVDGDTATIDLGEERAVEAVVSLGDLDSTDVSVELVHGVVGADGVLISPTTVAMTPAGPAPDGHVTYAGTFTCEHAGRYGLTVRVVPNHPDLVTPVELGKVAWAS
jgi:starch phosphorylase